MCYNFVKNIQDHQKLQDKLTSQVWPEFMLQDAVCNRFWFRLFTEFSDFQFTLLEKSKAIGVANSLPLAWHRSWQELPEEGWDWALEKGFEDSVAGKQANILVGLQIAVHPEYQRKGLSKVILQQLKKVAERSGFSALIIPVRPSQKSHYPLQSIDEYITWRRADGRLFDNWLRVHEKIGGKIIKACKKAMYISGTVSEWETWTDLKFKTSGKYIVPGALVPVQADLHKDLIEYVEPNVWVLHELERIGV